MIDCTRKPLKAQAVEQAMKEHDGLVNAFIQRQGGGDISYSFTQVLLLARHFSRRQISEVLGACGAAKVGTSRQGVCARVQGWKEDPKGLGRETLAHPRVPS
jgi:hypothetical protein